MQLRILFPYALHRQFCVKVSARPYARDMGGQPFAQVAILRALSRDRVCRGSTKSHAIMPDCKSVVRDEDWAASVRNAVKTNQE